MSGPGKTSSSILRPRSKQSGHLVGSGKMVKLINGFDWAKTSLGPLKKWPQSLRTAINIVLETPIPTILLWSKDGVMLYNDAYAVFAGKKHPSLLGSKVVEGWPEIADFNSNILRVCLSGKSLSYKKQRLTLYRRDAPEEVWMDLSYSPVLGENSKPAGVLAVIVDITQSVLAEQERKQAEDGEKHFRFMAETLPLKIFTADADGKITYFNPQWTEYTGIPMKVLRRKGVQQLLHPDDLEPSMRGWREALKDGQPLQNEQRLRRHDGQYRRHISFVRAMHNDNGKVISWFGSMTDIEDILQTAVRKDKLEIMTAGLKEQRAQLLAINKVKDEFIALASHQLRTPATAVKQYISLVLNDYFGPLNEGQSKNLQIAYDSNERELNIINDLLKTAQIDSKMYVLDKRPQDISDILDEVIKELSSAIELKKQTVIFEGRDLGIKAPVDRNEMKLVFINLLENASKYSHPGKTITIKTTRKDKYLEIKFTDQGVGISSKDSKQIFGKFTRINNELSDTVSGSGLGLYWVKQIIMLHKGTIKVHSIPGRGSSFIVRLPL